MTPLPHTSADKLYQRRVSRQGYKDTDTVVALKSTLLPQVAIYSQSEIYKYSSTVTVICIGNKISHRETQRHVLHAMDISLKIR